MSDQSAMPAGVGSVPAGVGSVLAGVGSGPARKTPDRQVAGR